MPNTHARWQKGWVELEEKGNVGIEYVINPYLYAEMAHFLASHPDSTVVDVGAGTNILARQFMHSNPESVPALGGIENIDEIRKNVKKIIGLEENVALVERAIERSDDVIAAQHFIATQDSALPFEDASVDLVVSRNFLMHLPTPVLAFHLSEVARVLTNGGSYIAAFLNPSFEQQKFLQHHARVEPLKIDEEFEYPHGTTGEYGSFRQFWKDIETYESYFSKNFSIAKTIPCVPITDAYKDEYARYYQPDLPLAFVYVLVKNDDNR